MKHSAVKAPLSTSAAQRNGVLFSLLLIALGVIGIREALIYTDVINGAYWIGDLFKRIDGLRIASWMLLAGVLLFVIGLHFIVTGLSRRKRLGWTVTATEPVFVTPTAATSTALAAARRVDGVLDVVAQAKPKRVTFSAKATATDDTVRSSVEQAISGRFAALKDAPKTKVRLRQKAVES